MLRLISIIIRNNVAMHCTRMRIAMTWKKNDTDFTLTSTYFMHGSTTSFSAVLTSSLDRASFTLRIKSAIIYNINHFLIKIFPHINGHVRTRSGSDNCHRALRILAEKGNLLQPGPRIRSC
ncbi:hypothetical protein ATCV1_z451L [Acanthocystis turfacea chlorella virus 1]|uniref:Uncharacterized protein z451L n=1 Tax=Chlorovirus heliozoae TaxID=322019 RepID=A7K961_9PHYC|nr:hypothetical protein ATCV1_z451L [Acanthocystis turfacea chlorella virus 1]ABT16585.1 hypothetical protein ATCV1_z451L [Acanthocystis turfacea chlorella virus 1]